MIKYISIVIALIFVGILAWFIFEERQSGADVRSATAEVIYENATEDLIVVDQPLPGETLQRAFQVSGEARGNWYFEAGFPVEVRDAGGGTLWQGPASARGDWMTTEFVPYSVDVLIASPFQGAAMLVLHKDNPSGLPQNEASVSFPIMIK